MEMKTSTTGIQTFRETERISASQYQRTNNYHHDKNELNIFDNKTESNYAATDNIHDPLLEKEHNPYRKFLHNGSRTLLGCLASRSLLFARNIFIRPAGMKKLASMSKNLTQEEIVTVNNAADSVLSSLTNLGKNGTKIINVTDTETLVGRGFNAQYWPNLKEVHINREKLPLATFHELGHAYDKQNSVFWNYMENIKYKSLGLAGFFAMLPALIKKEVPKEGEELTSGQKLKNGFRKACPILAMISTLPIVLEENMASIRGNQWAKVLLNPELSQKVVKSNMVSMLAYSFITLAMGIGGYAALKIKDSQ